MSEEQQLLRASKKEGSGRTTSKFGVACSTILCFAVGAALIYFSTSAWEIDCDQQFPLFLCGFGVSILLLCLVHLALLSQPAEIEDTTGVFACKLIMVAAFIGFGVLGSIFFLNSHNCDATAKTQYELTKASVVLFLIVCLMLVTSIGGSFGGPAFAVVGHLAATLMQALSELFNDASSALQEQTEVVDNPPPRNQIADAALVINHVVFMWFFVYIVHEAHVEKDLDCDSSLHTYLFIYGISGAVITYFDFLYERFAGAEKRKRLEPLFPYLWWTNAVIWTALNVFGAYQLFTSETCSSSSKNVYRLSFILVILFFAIIGIIGLVLLFLFARYLLSGRVKVVMVVEADIKKSNNEEEEDDD